MRRLVSKNGDEICPCMSFIRKPILRNKLLRSGLVKCIKSNRSSGAGKDLLVFRPKPRKANRRNCWLISFSIMGSRKYSKLNCTPWNYNLHCKVHVCPLFLRWYSHQQYGDVTSRKTIMNESIFFLNFVIQEFCFIKKVDIGGLLRLWMWFTKFDTKSQKTKTIKHIVFSNH